MTVTHNPPLEDGRLRAQVESLARVAPLHLIIDNASANVEEIERLARTVRPEGGCEVLRLSKNLGVAGAVNVGLRECLRRAPGAWVLLLDHDTCFFPDSFQRLADEVASIDPRLPVGVMGFNSVRRRLTLASPYNQSGSVISRHSVITAGSLVAPGVAGQIPLDESFFMYYVDVDFCHRVENAGYTVLQLAAARADTREGQLVVRGSHAWSYLEPWRLYYVARNGIRVFRRYRRLTDLVFALQTLSMNLLVRESTTRSVVEFSRGVIDGVRSASAP